MRIACVIFFAVLTLVEVVYVALARRLHLATQRPESSFVPVGGGVIFLLGALLPLFFEPVTALYTVLTGGAVLAAMSFIDDVRGLSPVLRLSVQFAVVALVLHPLLLSGHYDIYILALIGVVGYMNSSNFMDGINGMLAAYSFVVTVTLYVCIDTLPSAGISPGEWLFVHDLKDLCTGLAIAIVVFGLFNFRRRALVYAGDVGSITAGYFNAIVVAVIAIDYRCPSVLVVVSVYLIDTFCTFLQRLFNGEQVLTPHRKHLYQQLVRRGRSPLAVSAGYAAVQLLVNLGWLATPASLRNLYAIMATLLLVTVFISLKIKPRQRKKY